MASDNKYTGELRTATRAVHLASLLTKQHLLTYQSAKSKVSEETKSDASEVTVADFAAQAVIIGVIHEIFPDDSFIAEESSDMLRTNDELTQRVWELVGQAAELARNTRQMWAESGIDSDVSLPQSKQEMLEIIDLGQHGGTAQVKSPRTWVLDPIDGTKTYIRAQQYAVCLCLVDEGEQQLAVLGCSNLNLDQRDLSGRLIIREDVVDLDPRGGWMLSALKAQGTHVERISQPGHRIKVTDMAGSTSKADQIPGDSTSSRNSITLRFTDSSASPHISKDLHNSIFEYFMPSATDRKLSQPAVPEGFSSLAVDLWSMQMKYVILALRGSGADAMVRVPPQKDYHAAVWDHAGGQLLLTESGGVLTDADGKDFVLDGRTRKLESNWGVCAARGGNFDGGFDAQRAHDAVLDKVSARVADKR